MSVCSDFLNKYAAFYNLKTPQWVEDLKPIDVPSDAPDSWPTQEIEDAATMEQEMTG